MDFTDETASEIQYIHDFFGREKVAMKKIVSFIKLNHSLNFN